MSPATLAGPSNVLMTGVSKQLGQRDVLRNVDVRAQGGITTVLGANGAGKTTLLRCLATALQPDGGQLLVDGLDPTHEADRIEIRRRLGYQPQDVQANRRSTVYDVMDYLAVLKKLGAEQERRNLILKALQQVGLADRAGDRVADLSGGMRQRVGVAQALLGHPTLVILDEPAAGLDPDQRLALRSIISGLATSATVIVSTHLTDEAAAISDQILVMDHGNLVFTGTPGQLAAVANGAVWLSATPPTGDVRATWRLPDGRHRCLGAPPDGSALVDPTVEDGYLLLVRT